MPVSSSHTWFESESVVKLYRQHALWYQLEAEGGSAYLNVIAQTPPDTSMTDLHRWHFLAPWEAVIGCVENLLGQALVVSPVVKPDTATMMTIRAVHDQQARPAYLYLPYDIVAEGAITESMISEGYSLTFGNHQSLLLLDDYSISAQERQALTYNSVVLLPGSFLSTWAGSLYLGHRCICPPLSHYHIPCQITRASEGLVLLPVPNTAANGQPVSANSHQLQAVLTQPALISSQFLHRQASDNTQAMNIGRIGRSVTLLVDQQLFAKGELL
ncbi:hypothetical protein N9J26_01500, partial [bacterium]|nr:hypothetical protein [bacterium]